MAAVVALAAIFMRPLSPTEGAETGDGLIAVLLVLLAAALWAAQGVSRRRLVVRVSGPGVALAGLVAVTGLSVLAAAHVRPAVNLAVEWLGMGVAFLLVRHLWSGPAAARAVLAGLVALGAAEAVYGLYQFGWGLEVLRQEYRADPAGVLARLPTPILPGSVEQEQFERRLLYSSEPLGTFALANSLAGFLVLVLPLAVALAVERPTAGRTSPVPIAAKGLVALVLLAGLVLTKSRSAWLALVLVAGGAGVALGAVYWRRYGRPILLSLAAGAAVVVAVFATGTLDPEVISEAPKSLRYRLEYWEGAIRVIEQSPWLGVGPGNFGEHYLRYKRPEASEEVRDPHNMLLEAWASSGPLAAMALVAIFVGFARRMTVRGGETAGLERVLHGPGNGGQSAQEWSGPEAMLLGLVGGLAAFAWTALLGLTDGEVLAGMAAAWTAAYAIMSWPWSGATGQPGPAGAAGVCAASAALGVHLMTSSGLSFPALGGMLWVVMACGLEYRPTDRPKPLTLQGLWPAAVTAVFLLSVAALSLAVVLPQTRSRRLLNEGRHWAQAGRLDLALSRLQEAVAADPLDTQILAHLAGLYVQRWHNLGEPAGGHDFHQAVACLQRVVDLDPFRSSNHLQLGRLYVVHYRRHQDRPSIDKAVGAVERAVALYPNHASRRGELAAVLWLAGRRGDARREAAEALWLDSATPHVDRKLRPAERAAVSRILQEAPAGAVSQPARSE